MTEKTWLVHMVILSSVPSRRRLWRFFASHEAFMYHGITGIEVISDSDFLHKQRVNDISVTVVKHTGFRVG